MSQIWSLHSLPRDTPRLRNLQTGCLRIVAYYIKAASALAREIFGLPRFRIPITTKILLLRSTVSVSEMFLESAYSKR
jgi:hypothetical protein